MSITIEGGREPPTTPQGWDDEAAKLFLFDPYLFDAYAERGRPGSLIVWVGARGLAVLGIAYTETYESNHPHSLALAVACHRMKTAIEKEMTINQIYGEIGEINNG